MSNYGDYRETPTGQYRFRLQRSWFRDPLVILQMEKSYEKNQGFAYERWERVRMYWYDVGVEDLTTMSLTNLIKPRDGGELPICFKPRRRLFGWSLVLQVCDGAYDHNNWRPARLQDLIIKDGKISGGLGLMRR